MPKRFRMLKINEYKKWSKTRVRTRENESIWIASLFMVYTRHITILHRNAQQWQSMWKARIRLLLNHKNTRPKMNIHIFCNKNPAKPRYRIWQVACHHIEKKKRQHQPSALILSMTLSTCAWVASEFKDDFASGSQVKWMCHSARLTFGLFCMDLLRFVCCA